MGYKIRQFYDEKSSTYSYLIHDEQTRLAILIDPVLEQKERDLKFIQEMGLKLTHVFETHVHADHITSAGMVRKETGAQIIHGSKTGCDCADIMLEDGETISIDSIKIKALHTPGHTSGCTNYLMDNHVFTGDTLLIRSCGRTDFQSGSAATLYNSIKTKLYTLPDDTIVHPAHDYLGRTESTIGEEKSYNPRINQKTVVEEFVKTMDNLNLPYPKQIDRAVPANQKCGEDLMKLISVQELEKNPEKYVLVDVRRDDEYEEGHIKNTIHAELGGTLLHYLKTTGDKSKPHVFICRSGGRSGKATELALEMGFEQPYNMEGGMLAWESAGFKVEK